MKVVEMEKPQCGADEVLLKIHYVGFCGSDLNTYRGLNPMVKMPVIPGHEIGAEIAEVGCAVPAHLSVGMPVTVNPYTNCGHCPSCKNRRYNACQHNETLGVQRNGAMCEYIAVPWQKVIPIGKITVEHAALIEPMSVGFHAVSRAQVVDTDTVMVIDCGMVGVGAVVRAIMRGAKVIACDMDDEKLAIVRGLVIEAVGAPVTYQMAVNEVAFTGRVVCIGYAKQDVSFTTKLFVQKELDIRGSRNAQPEDFEGVIRYLEKKGGVREIDNLVEGTIPWDILISNEVTPEHAEEAMQQWMQAPAKVFRVLVKFAQ